MEVSHHIKVYAIHRVVKSEVVTDSANLKLGSVTFQIATVSII